MRKRWPLAALLLACSDDSKSLSDRYVAKLRSCGMLSEGKLNVQLAADQACALRCYAAASCDDVRLLECGGFEDGRLSDSYTACHEKCSESDPGARFECEDGSSDVATRCDLDEECDDGSDERDCPASAFFVCSDGERVPKYYACDGDFDCEDESDEAKCEHGPGLRCKDGETVFDEHAECDGLEDCADGSDELSCVQRGLVFECDGEQYVNKANVCDGVKDCQNSSDEEQGCATLQCGD